MAQTAYISLSCLPLPTFIEGRHLELKPDGRKTNQVHLEYFVFAFVRVGHLTMVHDGVEQQINQGEVFIMTPGYHKYTWWADEDKVELDWIYAYVAGDWHVQLSLTPAQNSMKSLMLHPEVPVQTLFLKQFRSIEEPEVVYPMVDQLVSKELNCDSKQFFEAQGIFIKLISWMQIQDNAKNEVTQMSLTIQKYLKKNFSKKITAATLSKHFNLRPNYIVRVLRQTIGLTPAEFLMQYRMEEATQWLLNTEASVEDIALNVGFQNIYYFSTSFKKYTGVSPTQYRQDAEDS
ncbi:helix-turn-helix transcriptional regulator [Lactobacillus sp. LC28-10]|uniref:Helix-turn-helix transcriptional regulator n=1 Tax=Secundilactobacillus angelensis TaxID=2722706 RepID=A0ABX1KVW5_9LACO|nr:helix-turn-helix transcriptional regulator [Secundilactobacillus angelensis]MCH5462472.1 helix-turn-helix transcriptional regulator [Secundilactobacillus angelensis]NLR18046.1 helix-turn-helix transcriptional regulator [Secundilactobacillus angelensis]